MSLLDKQIKERMLRDDELYRSALAQIAEAVEGAGNKGTDADRLREELNGVARYYRAEKELRELPGAASLRELAEALEPCGIAHRSVTLTKAWYRDADEPILGTVDGIPVVFMPGVLGRYRFTDPRTGKKTAVGRQNEARLGQEGVCFYREFPDKPMGLYDLVRFCLRTLHWQDLLLLFIVMAVATAMGVTLPYLNALLFDRVIPEGDLALFYGVAGILLAFALGMALLEVLKKVLFARIRTRIGLAVESAAMLRVLSLPADMTQGYSTGELTNILSYFGLLCNELFLSALTSGLTLVFSLVYLIQIRSLTPQFSFPAQCIVLAVLVHIIVCMLLQNRVDREILPLLQKERGMEYALLDGIQKIKLNGSEKRMFARWADVYAQRAALEYRPALYLRLAVPIGLGLLLAGYIWIYAAAFRSGTTSAEFFAFSVSYGALSAALKEALNAMLTVVEIVPVYGLLRSVLETPPESAESRTKIRTLSGKIELNNVSFRYQPDSPDILKDLSFRVEPGEFVAIVGVSGCGKSTLLKLLLKFCTPQKGSIAYDGMDLRSIDQISLRRNIGTVLQNGSLFMGDIFSNIAISAPTLTMDEAWEAAEMAGLAEDIRAMPMGMHTMVGNQNVFSGGQIQRLMIARALAGKPKILLFDEATSALDNVTQKQVSDAIATLHCTRIVIAHRLSTIRSCDRILVLDRGRIAEEGSYDELMAKQGLFAQLARRQIIEEGENAHDE